jgi:ABC-type sugar transport system ATPase subunit
MGGIRLEGTTKVYPNGVKAIDDVTWTSAPASSWSSSGPPVAASRRLLRMIAGLEEVTEGRILIGDRDVTALRPRDRDIAMVFQNYALYPHMTVERNLGFGSSCAGCRSGAASRGSTGGGHARSEGV